MQISRAHIHKVRRVVICFQFHEILVVEFLLIVHKNKINQVTRVLVKLRYSEALLVHEMPHRLEIAIGDSLYQGFVRLGISCLMCCLCSHILSLVGFGGFCRLARSGICFEIIVGLLVLIPKHGLIDKASVDLIH